MVIYVQEFTYKFKVSIALIHFENGQIIRQNRHLGVIFY